MKNLIFFLTILATGLAACDDQSTDGPAAPPPRIRDMSVPEDAEISNNNDSSQGVPVGDASDLPDSGIDLDADVGTGQPVDAGVYAMDSAVTEDDGSLENPPPDSGQVEGQPEEQDPPDDPGHPRDDPPVEDPPDAPPPPEIDPEEFTVLVHRIPFADIIEDEGVGGVLPDERDSFFDRQSTTSEALAEADDGDLLTLAKYEVCNISPVRFQLTGIIYEQRAFANETVLFTLEQEGEEDASSEVQISRHGAADQELVIGYNRDVFLDPETCVTARIQVALPLERAGDSFVSMLFWLKSVRKSIAGNVLFVEADEDPDVIRQRFRADDYKRIDYFMTVLNPTNSLVTNVGFPPGDGEIKSRDFIAPPLVASFFILGQTDGYGQITEMEVCFEGNEEGIPILISGSASLTNLLTNEAGGFANLIPVEGGPPTVTGECTRYNLVYGDNENPPFVTYRGKLHVHFRLQELPENLQSIRTNLTFIGQHEDIELRGLGLELIEPDEDGHFFLQGPQVNFEDVVQPPPRIYIFRSNIHGTRATEGFHVPWTVSECYLQNSGNHSSLLDDELGCPLTTFEVRSSNLRGNEEEHYSLESFRLRVFNQLDREAHLIVRLRSWSDNGRPHETWNLELGDGDVEEFNFPVDLPIGNPGPSSYKVEVFIDPDFPVPGIDDWFADPRVRIDIMDAQASSPEGEDEIEITYDGRDEPGGFRRDDLPLPEIGPWIFVHNPHLGVTTEQGRPIHVSRRLVEEEEDRTGEQVSVVALEGILVPHFGPVAVCRIEMLQGTGKDNPVAQISLSIGGTLFVQDEWTRDTVSFVATQEECLIVEPGRGARFTLSLSNFTENTLPGSPFYPRIFRVDAHLPYEPDVVAPVSTGLHHINGLPILIEQENASGIQVWIED